MRTKACVALSSSVLFLGGVLWARPVKAQGEAQATLVHVDCARPTISRKELGESVRLELEAQGIQVVDTASLTTDDYFILEVRTDCKTRRDLVLRIAQRDRAVEQAFSLADVPHSAEPRTVALALAELLEDFRSRTAPTTRATGHEPARAPSTASKQSAKTLDLGPSHDDPFREPAVTATPVTTADDDTTRIGVSVGVEQRTFDLRTSLVGLHASFSLDRMVLGASLLRGQVSVKQGTITSMLGNLTVGYRVAEVINGRWTLAVSPRLGAGSVVATSSAVPGVSDGSASDVYGDVAARVMVGTGLWKYFHLTLLSEAGYARGMIPTADGEPAAEYAGVFLGVALLGSFRTPPFDTDLPPRRVTPRQ